LGIDLDETLVGGARGPMIAQLARAVAQVVEAVLVARVERQRPFVRARGFEELARVPLQGGFLVGPP